MVDWAAYGIIRIKRDTNGNILENPSNFDLPKDFIIPSGLKSWYFKINDRLYRASHSSNSEDSSETILLVDCTEIEDIIDLYRNKSQHYQKESAKHERESEHHQKASEEDSLTQTLNRRGFLKRLQTILPNAQPTYIAMLDINDFKQMNSKIGHVQTDELLRKACSIIQFYLKSDDLFARYGGDEFIFVFPNSTLEEINHTFINKIIPALQSINITFAMGISKYPANTPFDETIYSDVKTKADGSLYTLKKSILSICPPDKKFSCIKLDAALVPHKPNNDYR